MYSVAKAIYCCPLAVLDNCPTGTRRMDNCKRIACIGSYREPAAVSNQRARISCAELPIVFTCREVCAKSAHGRVLLTAPGKGDMKNIVFGVNDNVITDEDKILSAASCTTNAITPALKVLDDAYGVERGHVETVHAFTNDQNLIDNFHKGDRRGRSAVLNMVITETGAAKAVSKALPQLEGKLTGNAIRVPTPDVSMAILNVKLTKPAGSAEELNELFRRESIDGELRRQVGYSDSPEAVSTDFVGSRTAGVVDSLATVVTDDSAIVYVWYDNEFGYSCQVIRVLERMGGYDVPSYPDK